MIVGPIASYSLWQKTWRFGKSPKQITGRFSSKFIPLDLCEICIGQLMKSPIFFPPHMMCFIFCKDKNPIVSLYIYVCMYIYIYLFP